MKEELKKIDFHTVSISTAAQQICNKLDHELGKVVDLLTTIVCKTVRNDRFEPSYITAEKKKLKNLHKKANKKKCPFLMKKCRTLERKIKRACCNSKKEQDLLRQVSRLWKREELKLCKFLLSICNLKVSL